MCVCMYSGVCVRVRGGGGVVVVVVKFSRYGRALSDIALFRLSHIF